jgi:hypothetical protein
MVPSMVPRSIIEIRSKRENSFVEIPVRLTNERKSFSSTRHCSFLSFLRVLYVDQSSRTGSLCKRTGKARIFKRICFFNGICFSLFHKIIRQTREERTDCIAIGTDCIVNSQLRLRVQ